MKYHKFFCFKKKKYALAIRIILQDNVHDTNTDTAIICRKKEDIITYIEVYFN